MERHYETQSGFPRSATPPPAPSPPCASGCWPRLKPPGGRLENSQAGEPPRRRTPPQRPALRLDPARAAQAPALRRAALARVGLRGPPFRRPMGRPARWPLGRRARGDPARPPVRPARPSGADPRHRRVPRPGRDRETRRPLGWRRPRHPGTDPVPPAPGVRQAPGSPGHRGRARHRPVSRIIFCRTDPGACSPSRSSPRRTDSRTRPGLRSRCAARCRAAGRPVASGRCPPRRGCRWR